ncbi:hypothetical protein K2Z84_09445 [Candidatus Binatia bacterium]|nr:hypothetical protein [Candidatus Binatia bacterium]
MATPDRRRLLRQVLTRPHRYRRVRAITMGITLAILFGVPLLGLARLDLFGDAHRALLRPVDFAHGLTAVLAAIVAFYVVTFTINMPAGRMFCGFGCPVGQLSRFADAIDAFPNDPLRRRRGWLELGGFALVLSLAVTLWWTAPASVLAWPAAAFAMSAVSTVAAAAVLHGRRWRWGFCRGFCPIGLYYSVVETGAPFGIDFDSAGACIDCGACDTICPVHLEPRTLEAEVPAPGGLAFDGLPGLNHCLHCGLCVEVCELVTQKQPGRPAMGLRRLHRKPRRLDRRSDVPAVGNEPTA